MAESEEEEVQLNSECSLCERDALVNRCRQAFREHFDRTDEGPFYFAITPGRVYMIGEYAQQTRDRALAFTAPFYMVAYGRRRRTCDESSLVYNCSEGRLFEILQPYGADHSQRSYEPRWARVIRGILAVEVYMIDVEVVLATSIPDGVNMGQEAAIELCIVALVRRLTAYMHPNPSRRFSTLRSPPVHALNVEFHGRKDIALVLIDSGVRCPDVMVKVEEKWKRVDDTSRVLIAPSWVYLQEAMIRKLLRGDMFDIATHMYHEVRRSERAVTALLDNNYTLLGKMLTESHISSRDLFHVSCPEVDEIVNLSLEVDGVLGSRIAGYGFGGFVITLVVRKSMLKLVEHIKANYNGDVTFRECLPVEGVRVYSFA